ncbi:MAG TPA: DUF2934 domain-containing protein [Steroidobacteraceae bacterium]|nr:DUF2934 domain-containing protein [Steroidobacteraceae bacterium]
MANRRLPDPKSTHPTVPAETAVHNPPRARKSPSEVPARVKVTAEARRGLIAETAYLRAERRGFAPGHDVDDWLAAEAEVDALLRVEH